MFWFFCLIHTYPPLLQLSSVPADLCHLLPTCVLFSNFSRPTLMLRYHLSLDSAYSLCETPYFLNNALLYKTNVRMIIYPLQSWLERATYRKRERNLLLPNSESSSEAAFLNEVWFAMPLPDVEWVRSVTGEKLSPTDAPIARGRRECQRSRPLHVGIPPELLAVCTTWPAN